MDDEVFTIIFSWFVFLCIWMAITYDDDNKLANSPELKQCLSHTGAEWRDGECIISISK